MNGGLLHFEHFAITHEQSVSNEFTCGKEKNVDIRTVRCEKTLSDTRRNKRTDPIRAAEEFFE